MDRRTGAWEGPGLVLRAALAAIVVVLSSAGAAAAQAPVLATNGSTLQAPADLVLPGGADQCRARPYIGVSAGQIQFIDTGQSTCMWWSTQYGPAGQIVANTYVPRGAGAVTRVRVRSGTAPAPLRFAIVASGSGLCCTTKQVSAPVQPLPDRVNEFAVNLPAGSGVGEVDGSQFNDILVVVAVGPGSLPVNDRGAHGFLFGSAANRADASFLHPALALGESNTDVGIMDGYEVLLQYDWCGVPMTGANLRPVAPADPTTACLPGAGAGGGGPAGGGPAGGGGSQGPGAPLGATSSQARVRDGRARVRLRCLLDVRCAGRIRLLPRTGAGASAAAAKAYGSARYRISAGARATVRVRLTRAARAKLRRAGRLKARAAVTAGSARATLPLTLVR